MARETLSLWQGRPSPFRKGESSRVEIRNIILYFWNNYHQKRILTVTYWGSIAEIVLTFFILDNVLISFIKIVIVFDVLGVNILLNLAISVLKIFLYLLPMLPIFDKYYDD